MQAPPLRWEGAEHRSALQIRSLRFRDVIICPRSHSRLVTVGQNEASEHSLMCFIPRNEGLGSVGSQDMELVIRHGSSQL